MDYTVPGIHQARILEWVAFPFSRGSSQPRDQTQVSALQANYLPAEPQGKPKNTEVGSLSPLQGIFLTQELNRGLLHCRQILYQLRHKGSNSTTVQFSYSLSWSCICTYTYMYTYIHIFFLNAKIVSLKKNIMHTTKCGSIHFLKNIYLFIWLCWVLVVACRIFSYGMWDLVP